MAVKTKPAASAKSKSAAKSAPARISLADTMAALEKAGSAQTRKTYARHGATGPMFGVSFADIKALVKRIKVDHDLALALWVTGNLDARTLAVKIADPQRMSPKDLDRWAGEETARMYPGYVSLLAAEGPHGKSRAEAWLASSSETRRCSGWFLVGALASNDETIPNDWFAARIATIAKSIHDVPNEERKAMNRVLIAIGGRDASVRKEALAAAKRIGEVIVDHGDTQCETPDAAQYIEKAWSFAVAKGFASPAAQERSRESMRTRC
jgi:3-methyladenine DNA glycosylase AlkD